MIAHVITRFTDIEEIHHHQSV